jgi:hypothetical protein
MTIADPSLSPRPSMYMAGRRTSDVTAITAKKETSYS